MIVSPHGALFTGRYLVQSSPVHLQLSIHCRWTYHDISSISSLLILILLSLIGLIRSASADIATYVPDIPPVGATIAFMIFESIVFMGTAFYIDMQSIVSVTPVATVETVTNLDPDVEAERVRTEATTVSVSMPEATAVSVSVHVPVEAVVTDLDPKAAASESFHTVTPSLNNDPTTMMVPLKVSQLRKVFPPKQAGRAAVIANENVSFCVEKGEIFGLLGANGEMSGDASLHH